MPKAIGPSSTSMSTSQTRSAVAALTACVTILCFVPGSTCHLDWIGPRLEATGKKQEEFEFLLSTSCKELGRTDFDGEPKSLERGQRQYLVGHLKHFNEVIGEVYSPPRCTKEARKQGFKASIAMDLSTGWDFREPKDRRRALQCIAEKRPAVLVLSPPCTAFSRLRALTSFKRREADVRKELEEAMTHMRFCISLCKLQQKQGRGFILEQPRDATSWTMPEMVSLLEEPEVYRLCLDLCQFGLRATKGPYQGQLVKKPTALISNIPELAKHVEKKCDKSHAHGQLLGGAAKPAAEYTPSFVQAILNGVKEVLGLKVSTPTSKSASTSHWVTYGRTLGAAARNYATDQVELEEEVFLAYQSFGHRSSFPVNVEEDVDMEDVLGEEAPRPEEPEEHDAVSAVRRELRGLQDNPGFAKAMQEVETFEDMNDEPNTLAPQLRREVHRVHRNIGHPGKEIFLRALKNAGVRDEILQWTKAHFRCPTCEARTRPSPARPGHLLRALEFNQVVGADLCFADLFNEQVILLNVLCWGTNFQQAYICKDKSAEEVLEAFMRCWIQPFGVPSLLVLDRGKEFDNHLFKQTVGGLGVGLHYTDPQSPWQNSRTEKAGGLLKEKLRCTIHETTASREELQVVLAEVVAARNRYMDRFGFSPMQRVFGKNLRLPSSLLSTDTLNRDLVEAAAPDAIKRSWDIRDAAAREWLKRQDSNAVRRSLKANSRTADLKPIPAGTWIYVFRDTPSYRGWVGPGVVIAEDFTNRSAWVSMRGRLWKASREQIRPATPEEELGAELILELSQEMLQKLKKPGQIVYQDITQEDGPAEDDLDGDAVRQVLRVRENDPHGEPHPAAPAPAPVSQTDSTHQPEDVEMDSEEPSSLPTTSLNPSRRVSILEPTEERLPMEGIVEEEGAAPEASASEQPRRVIRVDENVDGAMTFGPIRRSDGRLTEVPETPPVGAPMPYPMNRGTPPLPRPPPSSYYIEVIDFDKDEDLRHLGVRAPFIGATWRFDREQRKPVLLPRALSDGKTFHGAYAEASYCYRDKCHYVTKSKASFGQVQFSKLDEKEKEVFRKARKKELDSLISNGAVRVLSLSESRAFERDFPDQVIDSKFVDRYKPKDIGTDTIEEYKRRAIQEGHMGVCELEQDQQSPKSRLCVVGWMDPQIHEVERSSPTPLSTSLHCCLQLAATRQWSTRVKDVKTAFLQSLPTTREKKLAVRQPKDETLPGLEEGQLLLLLTEVYGLVSGPSWWRRSFLKIATEQLGYSLNYYDRCVLTLGSSNASQSAKTEGFIVLEVDDIAEAGSPLHVKKMQQLESLLKFGKVEDLQSASGSNYAGRHIKQLPDFGFEISMDEYIFTRLEPIQLGRKVLVKDAATVKLTEGEKSQLRGLIASLNWVACEGRPDGAAAASILASAFPDPCVSHINAANDMVRHLKTFPVKLKIHHVPEPKLRHLLIADSSFDTSGREKSQHGWLLGFTNDRMNLGERSPVSLMQWRSKRLRRKAASSLLCEAISMSAATGALEKQDAFMESIRLANYCPRSRQRTEDEYLSLAGKSTVLAKESNHFVDPRALAVVDAKALFDALLSDQPQGQDERASLEISIIRESLTVVLGRPRWIPHNRNPADSLTKLHGAHVEPMLELLSTNSFCIEEEQSVLQQGRQSENRQKIGLKGHGNRIFWGLTDLIHESKRL